MTRLQNTLILIALTMFVESAPGLGSIHSEAESTSPSSVSCPAGCEIPDLGTMGHGLRKPFNIITLNTKISCNYIC
jgi:hypothetical protein